MTADKGLGEGCGKVPPSPPHTSSIHMNKIYDALLKTGSARAVERYCYITICRRGLVPTFPRRELLSFIYNIYIWKGFHLPRHTHFFSFI